MDQKKEIKEELRDHGTFELVFSKYYKPLVVYANTFMKDIPESQDIVQQVFVSFWEKRESLQIHTSLNGLLYKAVYNVCLNRIKQQKTRMNHIQEIKMTSSFSTAGERVQEKELEKKIHGAIDRLPEQCAKIFRMSRFEHLKYQEIADKLGLSVKTVENQMGKALKIMRESLKDYITLLILFLIIK